MIGSLQDQLLKAGLVTEEQLETARTKPKPAAGKPRGKGQGRGKGNGKPGRGKRRAAPTGEREAGAERSRGAKPNRRPGTGAKGGKARTQQPELSPEERALRDKVHAMITESTESREGGETPYHFVKGSRVKRIYVTDPQRDRLASDELAVAAMKGKHYLIPRTVAETIKELIPGYFIAMGSVDADSTSADSIDDEYADYQVPDDLTW